MASECSLLQINHYKSKSLAEWNDKMANLNHRGYMKNKWSDQDFNSYQTSENEVTDTEILRFLPDLKLSLQQTLPDQKQDKHYLVIVCMFRHEDDYLEEWLHFHILQGVEHFYLYDNENPESTRKLLQSYIEKGYVTLIKWPDSMINEIPRHMQRKRWSDYKNISVQNLAFRHFIKNYRDRFQWVIKIDIDEFIFPLQSSSVKSVIKTLDAGGLKIPRKNFGSSHHIQKPNGLVIENFTKCEKVPSHHKSIGNSDFIVPPSMSAHAFDYSARGTFSYDSLFDHVYLINLKRRQDRLETMRRRLERVQLQYELVEAVDGQQLIDRSGARGLLLTWINVFKDAIEKQYKNILIIEDDCIFHKDFRNLCGKYAKTIKKSDVAYLSANQRRWTAKMKAQIKKRNYYSIDEKVPTYGTACIYINKRVFPNILKMLIKTIKPVDHVILKLIRRQRHTAIAIYPNLAIQDRSDSDIVTRSKESYIQDFSKFHWDVKNYSNNL